MNKRNTVALYASGACLTVYVIFKLTRGFQRRRNIRKKILQKQESCKASFEKVKSALQKNLKETSKYQRILGLTTGELQAELQNGTISALDALHAYQSQTLKVNESINGATEFILEAEEAAAALDTRVGEKAFLHGLPVSLKESFELEGYDVTMGFGNLVGDVKAEDAVLVKVLKSQGAVPFVRTNVPQTLMTYESSNPVYGRTNNPYDVTRVPGGSTGGESALIASGASVLGMGSDIGGSIRVPSHFCGIYGLKTTTERLSRKGSRSLSKGQTLVSGTVGPMSRDFEGLVMSMKALLCDYHFQLDPAIVPLKFNNEMYEEKRPLRVGFYLNIGAVDAVPACRRAVLMAKQALEAQGHTVVEFKPPRIREIMPELFLKSVFGDRGKIFTEMIDADIPEPIMSKMFALRKFWKSVAWILSYLIQVLAKDRNQGEWLRAALGVKNVHEWFKQAVKLQEYKDEFLRTWREKNLDALICPVFGTAAFRHNRAIDISLSGTYSLLYNVLNYPAGSLPVTKVTNGDIDDMETYPKRTFCEKNIHKETTGSEGLPVNVQCVALPFQEELVLRLMREIETGLKST